MKKYWLFKSDPEDFNFEDMKKVKTTHWDGVRNFQARNFLRDEVKAGDEVFFYHSNAEVPGIMGICKVVKDGYADYTQFEMDNKHFYPSAKPENPLWYMVDIEFVKEFKNPVPLVDMKANPKLKTMKILQKGNRLSVTPVTKEEWDEVIKMSNK